MNSKMKNEVLSIIKVIADNIQWNRYINEHYLHHYFTFQLQQRKYEIDLTKKRENFVVHPEWPTYRNEDKKCDINIPYRRYYHNEISNSNKSENAKGGHFDFAIGEYNKPEIGIEFIWEYGWNKEEFIFDFLKCMDGALPFTTAISYSVIVREKEISIKGRKTRFEKSLNGAYEEAKDRLDVHNSLYDVSKRDVYLIVTEIGQNDKRHWYFDKSKGKFREEKSINNVL